MLHPFIYFVIDMHIDAEATLIQLADLLGLFQVHACFELQVQAILGGQIE